MVVSFFENEAMWCNGLKPPLQARAFKFKIFFPTIIFFLDDFPI
jgi:hypothetical protein